MPEGTAGVLAGLARRQGISDMLHRTVSRVPGKLAVVCGAPARRVYQITLAGSHGLQRWLDDSALTGERSRNLFLVRISLATGSRASGWRHCWRNILLDEYEAAARTRIDLLAALADRLAGRPE